MSTTDRYNKGLEVSRRSKKLPPFSLRLTFDERARLEQLAGDEPLGSYIKRKVFDGKGAGKKRARSRTRRPIKDERRLAQVLAMLGQSRIANNLNQLAKSANLGTLPMMPDTERDIRRACADVALMRRELLRALGHRTDVEPS
ncbi:plasmid mobilization relaxosome protein MobC [Epibacterium ulvae]|uniref:plasmid mobilization relaxosome protein MobC n=1 Tax=Epibacterium ulvae TaxID=1156985 RepID=UPI0024906A0B|nr:plasmid mobilization relaxosome protein MobC [Epibacterium ulvae]